MNNQEQLNMLKQLLTMVFSALTVLAPSLATAQQYSALETAVVTAIPALMTIGSVIWSIYSHWNMKKVPQSATAVQISGTPVPVGNIVAIAPPKIEGNTVAITPAMVKVVGALLIGFFVFQTMPASAQSNNIAFGAGQTKKATTPFNPADPLGLTNSPVVANISAFLSGLADIDGAQALAVQIPGLQDNVGAACWAQFAPIQALIKAHPLPVTLKVASDIEALRLAALAMNQVCANPNCGQMFLDATNAAAAISGAPIPISLASICSKIPVIGVTVAQTAPVSATPVVATPVVVAPAAK